MSLTALILLLIFLLAGLFCLTAVNSALKRLQKREYHKQLKGGGKLLFYRPLHMFFFPHQEFEGLLFANSCAQNVTRFCYAITSILITQQIAAAHSVAWPISLLILIGLFLLFFIFGDYLPRILGIHTPTWALRLTGLLASLFMLLTFPLTYLFLKAAQSFARTAYFGHIQEPLAEVKQELIDLIEESNIGSQLDPHDKKLIASVVAFKDRIAREIMVPRVDVFSLASTTTIQDAAKILLKEGYSRTPVYENTLDNIIGVLMYKDILAKYMEYESKGDVKNIQAPIQTLIKSVLYTPETKKISQLLQEFRNRQVHLAIVVDEYGGTEGIVTIEDILEEIVGDIADEYDEAEVPLIALPEGGWIIDARTNILDIEEQLGIEIPQDGDYDTIGGYIFHEAGLIPAKGFKLTKPDFEVEVLRSSDRCVEKVRIHALDGKANNKAS